MNRFLIKHAFNLKSANSRLLFPGQYVTPESKEQAEELTRFAKDGSCEELVSKPKTEDAKPSAPADPARGTPATGTSAPVDPEQDLSSVPGVGKAALGKLAVKGITTVDQLKAFVADSAKEAEVKEIFGPQFKKVQAHFAK